jgi:hypothetical protein
MLLYNDPKPPLIPIEGIKDIPIAMFSARHDEIVNLEYNE